MTTFSSPNVYEVSVQVKHKNVIYRSHFDMYFNVYQHNTRQRRSRAVSRISTTLVKCVLQKSKRVIITVQRHI